MRATVVRGGDQTAPIRRLGIGRRFVRLLVASSIIRVQQTRAQMPAQVACGSGEERGNRQRWHHLSVPERWPNRQHEPQEPEQSLISACVSDFCAIGCNESLFPGDVRSAAHVGHALYHVCHPPALVAAARYRPRLPVSRQRGIAQTHGGFGEMTCLILKSRYPALGRRQPVVLLLLRLKD